MRSRCWWIYERCPNGDGYDYRAYQLYKLDVEAWVKAQNSKKKEWVRGPVTDPKYEKILKFIDPRGMAADKKLNADFPWKEWIVSDKVYFKIDDYRQFHDGSLYGASIWILDGRNYRLYLMDWSM